MIGAIYKVCLANMEVNIIKKEIENALKTVQPCCTENLTKMLIHLARVFNENGLHYWLDWGALLGLIRDKALIPWDKDIDFGIFEEDIEKYNSLKPKIEIAGYKVSLINRNSLLSKDDFVPRVHFGSTTKAHCKNLCACDMFVWKNQNNKATLINCRKSPIFCNSEYYSKTEIITWKNVKIQVPSNVSSYLKMRYGESWKKADRTFYRHRGVGSD